MIDVVILTYNAEKYLKKLLDSIKQQTIEYRLIVIDSSSKDNTQHILEQENIDFIQISPSDFNHGGTRNLALKYVKSEFVLFLTQDALPISQDCFEKLINSFEIDSTIGLVYGRQVPYDKFSVFEAFPRIFNYPDKSRLKKKVDIPQLGLKTSFCSNSFSAYRKRILYEVGGFPTEVIFGEDACVASKMILNDYSIYYCAEAQVFHSHSYSLIEEFRRYFDIGVFHSHENWIIKEFKAPTGEGIRYVKEELTYIMKNYKVYLIPISILRTSIKFLGYQLGKREASLPLFLKKKWSMHGKYWK